MSRATAREWKPGDAAIGTVNGRPGVRVIAGWSKYDPHLRWGELSPRWADGDDDTCWFFPSQVTDLRPLVVIDPEDVDQVRALAEAYDRTLERTFPEEYATWGEIADGDDDGLMRDALRATIAQPGLEEPTALGAVVVDVEDQCYVRGLPLANSQQPWWVVAPHGDRAARWLSWDEFTAVTLIAPGVPA